MAYNEPPPFGLELISKQIASSSASIIFTGLSIYTSALLIVDTLNPATSTATLQATVSQNNGGSYLSTNYAGSVSYRLYSSATLTLVSSTTFFPLSGPMSNSSSTGLMINMSNFNEGLGLTFNGQIVYTDTTLSGTATGVIGGATNTGINAIKLAFSTGNIATGNFWLYGYK